MSKILSSQKFLLLICCAIFLFSIFLRSMVDIGSDTGFYIDLGKKISEGKRYYYDFFESNLPISFYFYALQYRLSVLSGINPIIISEIFINLLALFSIFWAAKILQRSSICQERRDYYNIIIVGCFLGFFLRIGALPAGEFGTKTSLLLILLYPYIAYSFLEQEKLNKKDLIWRGILMGLMPCFKPHYAIIIIVVEFYHFWQKKSLRFFCELDKLIALMIMALYLNIIILYTPEFIEFMVPMWSEFYSAYADSKVFYNNLIRHFIGKPLLLLLMTPIFLRLKFLRTDKILALIFIGATLLLALENTGTIDQEVIFYAIATICLLKFSYDFFSSKYFSFKENKFIILTLILIPAFDIENFFKAIFNLLNIWFLIIFIIFNFYKKQRNIFNENLILYLILTAISLATFMQNDKNLSVLVNMASFLTFLFLYEKSYTKLHDKFSLLLIFVVVVVNSYISYSYISTIKNNFDGKNYFSSPNDLTNEMVRSINFYAPGPQDSYLVASNWIAHQFPLMNYLDKINYFKYAVSIIYDVKGKKTHTIFAVDKSSRAFVFSYLLDDFKKQLQNPNIKIVFVNQGDGSLKSGSECNIRLLEYYLQDPQLRQIFMKNFRFHHNIVKYKKIDIMPKKSWRNKDAFDSIAPSQEKVSHDFEVYVRR